MDILLVAHSHLRWLVLLAAVIATIKFAVGWLRGGAFKGMDRALAAAFSGTLDLQATLGLINLLWLGFSADGRVYAPASRTCLHHDPRRGPRSPARALEEFAGRRPFSQCVLLHPRRIASHLHRRCDPARRLGALIRVVGQVCHQGKRASACCARTSVFEEPPACRFARSGKTQ